MRTLALLVLCVGWPILNRAPTFVALGVKLKPKFKPFYFSRRLEATLSSKMVSYSVFIGDPHFSCKSQWPNIFETRGRVPYHAQRSLKSSKSWKSKALLRTLKTIGSISVLSIFLLSLNSVLGSVFVPNTMLIRLSTSLSVGIARHVSVT
jgi:hypothetical protein